MRHKTELFIFFLAISFFADAQIPDPIPEPIKSSGITVRIKDWSTIRKSNNQAPLTRINMLRGPIDGSDRVFVNDLRGFLWLISNGVTAPFLSVKATFQNFIDAPGKGTGFGAFAFHPKFLENGIFYTSHAERANSDTADFKVPVDDQSGFQMQWVLVEWKMDDPASSKFEGTNRELIRWDFPNLLHGVQDITFNPNAEEGDSDFGMLYICIGDGGSSILFLEENIQNTSSHLGTIFRIDPQGSNSINGMYGIPLDNPFYSDGDAATLEEIWCYGFRNPHRISWDPEGDHKMIIGDIGEMNIEEINLGKAGANYGWGVREGTFLYNRDVGREHVFELPVDDSLNGFTYPVAMYDHDEGLAIVGGYVYRGSAIPELQGMYLCGDIVSGRLFVTPADGLSQGSISTLEELHLADSLGNSFNLLQEVPGGRADLRFGIDQRGELYILTKGDGVIRRFVSEMTTPVLTTREPGEMFSIAPNPSGGETRINIEDQRLLGADLLVLSQDQKVLFNVKVNSLSTTIDLHQFPAGLYYIRIVNESGGESQALIKQ